MAHTSIVQELVDYCNAPENQDFKVQFQQAVDLALQTGLEVFDKYGIKNLDDYFSYMDKYVYWVPSEDNIIASLILDFNTKLSSLHILVIINIKITAPDCGICVQE